MKRRKFIERSLVATSSLVFPFAPALAGHGTVKFGLTPVFMSNDLTLLNSFEEYLGRSAGMQVELVQKRTYQEITTLLATGRLDAAWICGYPFIKFRESLELLSVPVWRGKPSYQAYLIAATDRDANSIDDLSGDLHCFSDPDSNSGYLVAASLLADRGIHPDEFFQKTFFAYGHRNVVRAVSAKLAQSGSVDGYVWEVLNLIEPELTEKTKVIWKSDWLGFPPIAAPKSTVGTEKFEAIQQALIGMHEDPLGQEVLSLLQLDSFGPPDGSDFGLIAEMVNTVQDFG